MMFYFHLHIFQIFKKKKTLIIPPVSFYLCKVAVNHQSSYDERLKLCKVLRGFQVRSVTINRAVQFMNDGEDTQ